MLALVLACVLSADVAPLEKRLADYKAAMDKSAADRLARYEVEKKRLTAERNKSRSNATRRKAFEKSLAKLEEDKAFVEAGRNFIILDVDNGSTGDIGWIDEPVRAIQVVDARNLIVDFNRVTIWLEGFDTTNIADNQRVKPTTLFEVVGTKQYTAVGGVKRTARHLRPVPWEAWERVGGKSPLAK